MVLLIILNIALWILLFKLIRQPSIARSGSPITIHVTVASPAEVKPVMQGLTAALPPLENTAR
jgi:hypothetical protein